MITIRVDFNRRGRNGYVIGSSKRASGLVQPGALVRVYQAGESDMDFTAQVVTVAASGRVELDVNWPASDVVGVPGASVLVRSGRAPIGSTAPALPAFATGGLLSPV